MATAARRIERDGSAERCCPRAQMVQRQMRSDPEEPAAGALVVANPREVTPGAQKGLLREVVGRLFIARHPPEIGEDVALVRAKERLEVADVPLRARLS